MAKFAPGEKEIREYFALNPHLMPMDLPEAREALRVADLLLALPEEMGDPTGIQSLVEQIRAVDPQKLARVLKKRATPTMMKAVQAASADAAESRRALEQWYRDLREESGDGLGELIFDDRERAPSLSAKMAGTVVELSDKDVATIRAFADADDDASDEEALRAAIAAMRALMRFSPGR